MTLADESQTRRGSGGKRQEGMRRKKREANVARTIKQKGHVQAVIKYVFLHLCELC